MRKRIRIISLPILLCILLTAFSGCRGCNGDAVTSQNEGPNIESTNEAYNEGRGLSAGTLILTVNDNPVYWPEFYFWLNFIKKYYKNYHNLDKITDWGAEQNGMGLKEFFLSCAVGYACKDRAIEAKARELGIKLSEDDLAEIEARRRENIKIYGSELEYLRIVGSMYVSEDVFNYLTRIDYLGNHLFEYLYGAKGEKCHDEDVLAYIKEEGLMCAKYIFLSNTDPEGNELSEEGRAKNYRFLEDILARLDASDDPLTLFNALMNEYNEDTRVSNYPDGRLFVSGSMGHEFESAYLKLEENRYSGILKTDEGNYIILRKPIFPDMTADPSGNTLRYRTAYEHLFKNQIETLSAKMKVRYEDAYYKIDVEGLPEN